MEGHKLTRTLLILILLAATASAQPISAASGGSGTLALVINWGQVAVESLLEWAKKVLFRTKVTEPTGSSHKILITTGYPYEVGNITKIIDPTNENFACNLPAYPIKMEGGVGGIVEDDIPLICGGFTSFGPLIYECYKLIDKNWEPAGMLETGRSSMGTGNVVIDNQLLLSGGYDGSRLHQTSLMDTISTLNLKDMPTALDGHCIVKLDRSKILLIGGWDDKSMQSSETLIFDLENQQWSDGPRMRQGRTGHGCVKSNLGGKPIIWVTGGYDRKSRLQSTEYLEDLDQGWKSGPDLPYTLSLHKMVASEDSKAVYVTGGGGRKNNGQLIEMKCSGSTPDTCAFKPSATTNRVDRYHHIALPITDSVATKLCS